MHSGSKASTVHSPRSTLLALKKAMSLKLKPISLKQANEFVDSLHRHHKKVQGHKFSLAAVLDGKTVGVCIVGRPVARALDDGTRLEVTRLCTDGTKNACSFLYGAAARAAWALGYRHIGTYILKEESGVSLKASGYEMKHEVKGRSWSCPSRPREDKHPTVDKSFWSKENPRQD